MELKWNDYFQCHLLCKTTTRLFLWSRWKNRWSYYICDAWCVVWKFFRVIDSQLPSTVKQLVADVCTPWIHSLTTNNNLHLRDSSGTTIEAWYSIIRWIKVYKKIFCYLLITIDLIIKTYVNLSFLYVKYFARLWANFENWDNTKKALSWACPAKARLLIMLWLNRSTPA